MATGSAASSSGSHTSPDTTYHFPPLGPGPIPYPDYHQDVFYNSINKFTVQEWNDVQWPTKKARLEWRFEQWRNQLRQLLRNDSQWFAHICQMTRELNALQAAGHLDTTPLVVRQFLVNKWPPQGLETLLRNLAEWNPKGVITRSNSKPHRDEMLEFIERQIDAGENDYTANCTRNYVHKHGDI